MAPRLSLQPLARQCQSGLSRARASISSSAPVAALRNVNNPVSKILSLDDDSSPSSHGSRGHQSHRERGMDPTDRVRSLLADSDSRRMMAAQRRQTMLERARQKKESEDFMRQMPRRWKVGDVYAPHDLSSEEMAKWRHAQRPQVDVVDILGFNPKDEYRNFSLISEFITSMGRIKHSDETGLRPVNQRKMAKAIRRAIGLGLHPSVHRHPMILMNEVQNLPRQRMPTLDPPSRGR